METLPRFALKADIGYARAKVFSGLRSNGCLCLLCSAQALPDSAAPIQSQDFSETVIALSDWKWRYVGVQGSFGTGFCLDRECRFIGTAYHVAVFVKPRKIKKQEVIQKQLATGPDDDGAAFVPVSSFDVMKYTASRDLAIFELRHPIPHHHGIGFSLENLERGQEVDIYAYPGNAVNPIRKLQRFHGVFKGETQIGLFAFEYRLSADNMVRPGASGGIVVDSKSQLIVGILNEVAMDGELVAYAVPVQSLADFVRKAQPWLAQTIFPTKEAISPVAQDFYPKFVESPTGKLEHRPEEPEEVKILRSRAQLLSDSMRNFIAVQTYEWGSGEKEPAAVAAYEVRVIDGNQRFREYPDGKKEHQSVPFPALNDVIVSGGEWSELPERVGKEFGLKIHQAADATVYDRRIKVFQYWAYPEDGVCKWKSVLDLGFLTVSKTVTVACYGEVWTDEGFNILRISEHDELPGKWKDYRSAVNYGWLRRKGEPLRPIPVTISAQAEFKNNVYWCRGQFTDYRVFSSQVKILSPATKSPN